MVFISDDVTTTTPEDISTTTPEDVTTLPEVCKYHFMLDDPERNKNHGYDGIGLCDNAGNDYTSPYGYQKKVLIGLIIVLIGKDPVGTDLVPLLDHQKYQKTLWT